MNTNLANKYSQKIALGLLVCFALFLLSASSFISISFAQQSNNSQGSNSSNNNALVVPSQYPTIQSAINAAKSGDTVKVLPGVYTDQLFINKSITLLGSGAPVTIIKAPNTLVLDSFGVPWGTHIAHGATVTISGFTFASGSTPYAPCLTVTICGVIGVDGGATLYLSSSVIEYYGLTAGVWVGLDNASCGFRFPYPCSALSIGHAFVTKVDFVLPPITTKNGIFDGLYDTFGSTLQVSYSIIQGRIDTHFEQSDDVAMDTGSTVSITHDTLIGGTPIGGAPDDHVVISYNTIEPTGLSHFGNCGCAAVAAIQTDWGSHLTITYNTIIGSANLLAGISLVASANASDPTIAYVAHNSISNVQCTGEAGRPAGYCGANTFTKNPAPAIIVEPQNLTCGCGGSYPQITPNKITITDNQIQSSDIGIELEGVQNCCVVSNNVIAQSTDYGLYGADGNYTFSNNEIVGGLYGVTAVAGLGVFFSSPSANTRITMDGDIIKGTSIATTLIQTLPPYTAKVVFKK
jgi:hypothetical protein